MDLTQEFQQLYENINNQLNNWKKKIFALILFFTVVAVFKSFNNQHREIQNIQDSISSFYREFDVSILKNPAELKDLIEKVTKVSSPLTKIEEIHRASKEVDKKIEILQNFEFDKTGRPDLASKAAGGRIGGIGHDTKLFYSCNAFMKILNCPTKVNGPEKAIEASTEPGECFAFRGPKGTLILKLIGKADVDSITIEHVPKKMTPGNDVSEAPKVFNVSGLNSQYETPFEFGQFTFNAEKNSIKTFGVQKHSPVPVRYVKFDFEKNHGNPKKTCVYRLRVHGVLA